MVSRSVRAALGLRAHSGWAALVAIAGTPESPVVLRRERIELADPRVEGFKQPYHAAEGLPLPRAERIVGRCAETAARMATEAFGRAIGAVLEKGGRVAGCGLLLASGRPLPELASILASHALIHTADGELFREAIRSAAAASGLPVTAVRERELWAQAGQKLGGSAESIARRVAALGKDLGPPWRADEKLATGVALLALVRTR